MRVLFQSPTPARQHGLSSVTTSSSASASTTNPLHPLQKSISSASLKIIESSSDSSSCGTNNSSQSAPVSRQASHELSTNVPAAVPELDEVDDVCCVTPLKVISAAAQQLISVADKKTVAWDDRRLLEIEEFSNPCTPVQQSSRYKSEPNLCSMRPQVHHDNHDDDDDENAALTPIVEVSSTQHTGPGHMGKSLTRKLMKGVSMHNLRFPFSTPETTKRLVRSVSATLKRRPSGSTDDSKHTGCHLQTADGPLLEDMDDSDLEDVDVVDDDDDDDTLSETNGSSNELPGGLATVDVSYHQQLMQSSVYRNLDLITSTPALRLGRRSMSPITKSTQRMPKAMQVSAA